MNSAERYSAIFVDNIYIMIKIVDGTSAGHFPHDYEDSIAEGVHVTLPDSYLTFLRGANGGVPVEQLVKCGRLEFIVERFLSAIPDLSSSELSMYDIGVVDAQISDRLNDYLCPFAALFAGDFLCFDCEGRKEARVVIWNHELSDTLAPKLLHVCDTFEEFQAQYPIIKSS